MGKEVCWKGDIYRERSGEKRGSLGRDSEKKKKEVEGKYGEEEGDFES